MRNVRIYCLWVSEFPYPCVFNDGKDELRSLLPRRLVGTAVGTLCFVHGFRAHTDDGCGIVINHCFVSSHSCGFDKFSAVACCVRSHQPNEADEVVCPSRFFIRDLEEERRHDLPDSREVRVGRLSIDQLELFEHIGEFRHNFFGCHCIRREWVRRRFSLL